jgi:GMP synthase (glutamine-hydrolysing)
MNRPRTAVAIRHVAFEDLGLLAPVLESSGWSVSYREASIDDLACRLLDDADLLVVLGGPMGAYETDNYPFLVEELRLLERRLSTNKPTLGICLGCQLMAAALGAHVFAGGRKEIGWGRVSLTEEGDESALASLKEPDAAVLHWHGDTFELPPGAIRLAYNDIYENQAFSCGSRALALQFHLEADPSRLETWYVGHAIELNNAGISIASLRKQTASVQRIVENQTRHVFGGWLARLDTGNS